MHNYWHKIEVVGIIPRKVRGETTEYCIKSTSRIIDQNFFPWYKKKQLWSSFWYGFQRIAKLSLKHVTLSWRRSPSYRNQSIDLLCKSMDRILYDRELCHERVKNTQIFWTHLQIGSHVTNYLSENAVHQINITINLIKFIQVLIDNDFKNRNVAGISISHEKELFKRCLSNLSTHISKLLCIVNREFENGIFAMFFDVGTSFLGSQEICNEDLFATNYPKYI